MSTKIKASNIDIEDLAKALVDAHDFATGDPQYIDNVDVSLIAKAATNPNNPDELAYDKETVEKALSLYNSETDEIIEPKNIITKDNIDTSVEKILDNQTDVSSDDIRELRSELYALINSLSRKGYLRDYTVENGFTDAFNQLYPHSYDIQELGHIVPTGTNTITINKNAIQHITSGFYYIIETIADEYTNPTYTIVYIDSIIESDATDQATITIKDFERSSNEAIKIPEDENVSMKLLSVLGHAYNGAFSFSSVATDEALADTESEISFDDDTETVDLSVITPKNEQYTGFAFSCKVPTSKNGAITELVLYTNETNLMGNLVCYVMKDTDGSLSPNENNISSRFNNNNDAVISKSNTAYIRNNPSVNSPSELVFTFNGFDGKYHTQLEGVRYLFVIVDENQDAIGAETKFIFSKKDGTNDVQTHNKCYSYALSDDGKYVFSDNSFSNVDILFSLKTVKTVARTEKGFMHGLYISKPFSINNKCSDLELHMSINREGGNNTVTNSAVINGSNNNYITIKADPGIKDVNFGFSAEDTIVIGNKIATVKSISGNQLYIKEDDLHVKAGDNIYKIGYFPIIRLSYKDDNGNEIYDTFDLVLSEIHEQHEILADNISDKLIFKIKDDDNKMGGKSYYAGQLCIAWKSAEILSPYFNISENTANPSMYGRIYNIVITTSSSKM